MTREIYRKLAASQLGKKLYMKRCDDINTRVTKFFNERRREKARANREANASRLREEKVVARKLRKKEKKWQKNAPKREKLEKKMRIIQEAEDEEIRANAERYKKWLLKRKRETYIWAAEEYIKTCAKDKADRLVILEKTREARQIRECIDSENKSAIKRKVHTVLTLAKFVKYEREKQKRAAISKSKSDLLEKQKYDEVLLRWSLRLLFKQQLKPKQRFGLSRHG